jgi:hypothetical protein
MPFCLFKNYKKSAAVPIPPGAAASIFRTGKRKSTVPSPIIYAVAAGWFHKLPKNRQKSSTEIGKCSAP